MTLRPLLAAFVLSLGALCAPVVAEEHPAGMHIHDIYARTSAAGGGSGAIFFMVHNNSEVDDRLVAAKTDAAERAELHSSVEDASGMMTMVAVEDGLAVPAGEMLELGRGGDHIMLLGLTKPFQEGDTMALTLTFEVAGDITIEVPVDNARKPGAGGHDHGAMHHEGMDHDAMMGDDAAED